MAIGAFGFVPRAASRIKSPAELPVFGRINPFSGTGMSGFSSFTCGLGKSPVEGDGVGGGCTAATFGCGVGALGKSRFGAAGTGCGVGGGSTYGGNLFIPPGYK